MIVLGCKRMLATLPTSDTQASLIKDVLLLNASR